MTPILTAWLARFGVTDLSGPSPIAVPAATRDDLAGLFGEMGLDEGVELGVEAGRFSEVLLARNPRLHLTSVDAWQAYRGYRDYVNQRKIDGFYEAAQARLEPTGRCTLVKAWSLDAAETIPLGSQGFVYLDGNHEFDWIVRDLIAWAPRVRSGGVVSGHDYEPEIRHRPQGVITATHAYTQAHGIAEWFVVGGAQHEARSWFWVQP